eukprot:5415204-Amphidinium_carterae.1
MERAANNSRKNPQMVSQETNPTLKKTGQNRHDQILIHRRCPEMLNICNIVYISVVLLAGVLLHMHMFGCKHEELPPKLELVRNGLVSLVAGCYGAYACPSFGP